MKGTPKPNPITKTAKSGIKFNQNKPITQHRQTANLSRTRLNNLTRQNNNNTLRQHRRTASLSKKELSDLIGPKINKGISCTSVSQKRKYSHVGKCYYAHRQINRFKKCNKPHKPEVSHKIRSPIRSYTLRYNYTTPPGHKISRTLVPTRARVGQLPYLGLTMRKQGEKDESEEERQKARKQSKNTKQRKKSSKPWPVRRGYIDPEAFRKQIELVNASINNRQSDKPLDPKEVQNHLHAIGATVSKGGVSTSGQKKNPSKVPPPKGHGVQDSTAPEGRTPTGPTKHRTRGNLIAQNKRKRNEITVKTEPDSESSESQKQPKKKSKRSVISDTEDSTDSDDQEELDEDSEPPILKHRRRQIEIRRGGSNEKQNMLRNRSNPLFDHEGVNEAGNKYWRRNPDNDFKPPPKKPADGKSIKTIQKGK